MNNGSYCAIHAELAWRNLSCSGIVDVKAKEFIVCIKIFSHTKERPAKTKGNNDIPLLAYDKYLQTIAGKDDRLKFHRGHNTVQTCSIADKTDMAALSGLKLVAAQNPVSVSAIQLRRNKLAKRIFEQSELAKARQAGKTYSPTRFRTFRDAETGSLKSIEAPKRVKPWWFIAENGKLILNVRYGTRVLELSKGKFAVEVGTEKDLLSVLDTIKSAVLAGELDSAIDAAANKLREGFDR